MTAPGGINMCLSLAGGDGVGKKRAGAGRPAAGGAPLQPQCLGGAALAGGEQTKAEPEGEGWNPQQPAEIRRGRQLINK